MTQKSKTLEEKIYLTWYEDGIIDIYVGILLLALGLQMMMVAPYLLTITSVGGFFWVKHIKTKVTEARLGKVSFSAERIEAIARLKKVLLTFMFSAVAIGLIARYMIDGAPSYPKALPLGIIMIVGMWIVAQMVPLPRFNLYSILFGGIMAIDVLLGLPLVYAFLVSGGIIIFVGAGDYSRFKDKYPIREGGDE